MKISECNKCEHVYTNKYKKHRCGLAEKGIVSVKVCPRVNESETWTLEEKDRLYRLLNSGTHPRNVALIMKRPYNEVEDEMMLKYAPLHEPESCLNCGRTGYCTKQHKDGCQLTQWIRITPKQLSERFIMHTHKEGISWVKF